MNFRRFFISRGFHSLFVKTYKLSRKWISDFWRCSFFFFFSPLPIHRVRGRSQKYRFDARNYDMEIRDMESLFTKKFFFETAHEFLANFSPRFQEEIARNFLLPRSLWTRYRIFFSLFLSFRLSRTLETATLFSYLFGRKYSQDNLEERRITDVKF